MPKAVAAPEQAMLHSPRMDNSNRCIRHRLYQIPSASANVELAAFFDFVTRDDFSFYHKVSQ
jgi:hypothetical protein